MDSPVLLTVRGTLIPKNVDDARTLHNNTAGSAPGMEAARSLTDLSHCVYLPMPGKQSGAKAGELLFLDTWADPAGLQKFFSNKEVQEQGGKMFSSRDASVWMPARGAFTFRVPATHAKPARFVGLVRGTVKSPDATIDAFAKLQAKNLQAARRRGQISHELFVKMGPPNEAIEILGIDMWGSIEGLGEHYGDPASMTGLHEMFTGDVAASVWEQATGFNEW